MLGGDLDQFQDSQRNEQTEILDFDSVVLRRSDPDDCDQIINLVESGKDDIFA